MKIKLAKENKIKSIFKHLELKTELNIFRNNKSASKLIWQILIPKFYSSQIIELGKMQIVSRTIANPNKNIKLLTKMTNTIKTSHTLKDKTHQSPQLQKNQTDQNSEHKNKDERSCKSQIQHKGRGYISVTAKKRKISVQKNKFADSHLSEHPYQQQNQDHVERKFLYLQLNCNFLDLKADRQDVALPKRHKNIEKIELSPNRQIVNLIQTLDHHQVIAAHNITLQQSALISCDPLINQKGDFSDRTLTNIKTPINQLKFQESGDQDLINSEFFIKGPAKIDINTKRQTQQKVNKNKVHLQVKKLVISKNLAALSTSFN